MGLKGFGLTAHVVQETNHHLYANNLDPLGTYQLEPGGIFVFENISGMLSLKIMQGFYRNAMGLNSGFTHTGLRVFIINGKKHSVSAGLGPTLFYRQTVSQLENALPDDSYVGQEGQDWEFRFMPLSGELEYNFHANSRNDFTISLNHVANTAVALSFGYDYWLSPRRKPRGACSCPSFQ